METSANADDNTRAARKRVSFNQHERRKSIMASVSPLATLPEDDQLPTSIARSLKLHRQQRRMQIRHKCQAALGRLTPEEKAAMSSEARTRARTHSTCHAPGFSTV
eukprot:m.3502 g.3502  ORF g.3502 m.3502 type:complete len:106 (-) comp2316_c0_seq1:423-740(-)